MIPVSEPTEKMIEAAEREYRWSGNMRAALMAALAVQPEPEWEYTLGFVNYDG